MNSQSLACWRLHNLRLSSSSPGGPGDVVRWLGAVQCQDYAPALWSIGMRLRGATAADVEAAYVGGAILRTHVLRPTWHFVLPEDIRWLLDLTAPRVQAFNAFMYRKLELDEAVRRKSNSVIVKALATEKVLTRREIEDRLNRSHISTATNRLSLLLMHAELESLVCSGPINGTHHTYMLLQDRAPKAPKLTRDESLEKLALRYFRSHGPATIKDFSAWSSLSLSEVKKALSIAGSKLSSLEHEGLLFWFDPSTVVPKKISSPSVHLLQGYDEYLVGHRESKYLLDLSGSVRALPEHVSVYNQIILLDGQVAGHWKRTIKGKEVHIDAALYKPFTGSKKSALLREAERFGKFLGLSLSVAGSRLSS